MALYKEEEKNNFFKINKQLCHFMIFPKVILTESFCVNVRHQLWLFSGTRLGKHTLIH